MEHPIEHPTATPAHLPVQPILTGLDVPGVVTSLRPEVVVSPAPHPAASRQKGRRRYLSIRDLSRRLWLGRGYELLRALIHSGILPATRSARSWWIEDADVSALQPAFDDRAGKVRAFGGVDGWLRQRCWVVPQATPQAAPVALPPVTLEDALEALPADAPVAPMDQLEETTEGAGQPPIFHWRGAVYLPQRTWRTETGPAGELYYRHQSGATFAALAPAPDAG